MMTPAAYFGMPSDAKIFRSDLGSDPLCSGIQSHLSSQREYHLNRINIAEHCTDVSDNFGNEPAGERSYLWATVNSDGHLTSSFLRLDIVVLPEINFSGQASYLYPNTDSVSTTQTVAYFNV